MIQLLTGQLSGSWQTTALHIWGGIILGTLALSVLEAKKATSLNRSYGMGVC